MKLRWLLQVLSLITLTHPLLAKHITTFIPRSQGANTARELVGWQRELFKCYSENYCALAATAEYTHSMKTESIARNLLTSSCLTFSGSTRPDRQPTDILADYFGLPTDFLGTLAIKPRIENYIIDLNLYFGLDELSNGLYLRIHAPLTHTKWTLGLDSCIACAPKFRGCPTFPPCYMYSSTVQTVPCPNVNPMLNPLYQSDQNCATDSLRVALSGNFTFGDMTEAWRYGRFSFCARDKTGLADIDAIFGYNFWHNDFSHFGFFALTVVPTGNRPKAKYIFEPLVGNGKHWEFGGGLTTHLSTANPCFNIGFYIEGNVTWVFNTHQIRSFDFTNNGPLSRYMLLKEYDPDCSINGTPAGEFQGTYVYNGNLMNAINFATRNCEVHVGLKSDVSAKICISAGGWDIDAGYNFFYRNKETVCIKTECPCFVDQRFLGFKGTEPVCCSSYPIALVPPAGGGESVSTIFPNGTTFPVGSEAPEDCPPLGTTSIVTNEPSDATQPDATIFAPGTSTSGPVGGCAVCLNSGTVDSAGTPTADLTPANGFFVDSQPTLITCKDLDPRSAEQGTMMTHKVFGLLSYTWYQSCYEPFVGIGAEGEFDAHCDNALQQWGIWLKGGLAF